MIKSYGSRHGGPSDVEVNDLFCCCLKEGRKIECGNVDEKCTRHIYKAFRPRGLRHG